MPTTISLAPFAQRNHRLLQRCHMAWIEQLPEHRTEQHTIQARAGWHLSMMIIHHGWDLQPVLRFMCGTCNLYSASCVGPATCTPLHVWDLPPVLRFITRNVLDMANPDHILDAALMHVMPHPVPAGMVHLTPQHINLLRLGCILRFKVL
jgi:hypothetical protein